MPQKRYPASLFIGTQQKISISFVYFGWFLVGFWWVVFKFLIGFLSKILIGFLTRFLLSLLFGFLFDFLFVLCCWFVRCFFLGSVVKFLFDYVAVFCLVFDWGFGWGFGWVVDWFCGWVSCLVISCQVFGRKNIITYLKIFILEIFEDFFVNILENTPPLNIWMVLTGILLSGS